MLVTGGTQFGMLIAYLEKMQNEHASEMGIAKILKPFT